LGDVLFDKKTNVVLRGGKKTPYPLGERRTRVRSRRISTKREIVEIASLRKKVRSPANPRFGGRHKIKTKGVVKHEEKRKTG